MKRTRFLLTATGFAAASVIATGWSLAGIEGSKHDFSSAAWSGGEVCGACHTPHRTEPPKAAPLWDPTADLGQRFGVGAGTLPIDPGSGTLLCMRCHDGTIAPDTFGGVNRRRFVNTMHPGFWRTGHGRSDHPVGVEYPRLDRGFQPETAVIAQRTVQLPDGRVECISCHDPHNTSGEKYMLVTSNARSHLCLTCHRK